MDGVSAAASVIGVLDLGLKSCKFIFETISAIRDGPVIIRGLVEDVTGLELVLRRLSQCSAVKKESDQTTKSLIERCTTDIEMMAKNLEKLSTKPNEKLAGKISKRIRGLICEKDIENMQTTIRRHVSALTLKLGLLESEAASATRADISTITATLSGPNGLQEQFSTIGGRINSAATVSASQSEKMITILHQLQAQFQTQFQHLMERLPSEQDDMTALDEESPLEAVARLCELVNERETSLDTESDEANDIIRDLEVLLNAASELTSTEATQVGPRMPAKASPRSTRRRDETSSDLQLIQSLMKAGTKINLNRESPMPPPQFVPGSYVQQNPKHREFSLGNGSLTIRTTRRRRVVRGGEVGERSSSRNVVNTEFFARVSYIPNGPARQAMIQAFVSRHEISGGNYLLMTNISVNRILASDSEVFRLAAVGSPKDLQFLFSKGVASLRDHDENGVSLLHYAAATRNAENIRFLIENGADVDEVVKPKEKSYYRPSCTLDILLHSEHLHGYSVFKGPSTTLSECTQLLLDAGADPTCGNLLNIDIELARSPMFWTVLDRNWGFLDIDWKRTREYQGHDEPLLLGCCNPAPHNFGLKFERLEDFVTKLVSRGADPAQTDDVGNNCLHHLMQCHANCCLPINLTRKTPSYEDVQSLQSRRDLLIRLITLGADPRAVSEEYPGTGLPCSVSDLAYYTPLEHQEFEYWCCYNGDLFDCAVAACGYDLFEFRQQRPRHSRKHCRERYEVYHFKAIWEGYEHLCPWYDEMISNWASEYPPDIQDCAECQRKFDRSTTLAHDRSDWSDDGSDSDGGVQLDERMPED